MLKSALINDFIKKHPMDGVRYTKPVRAVNDIKFLTVDEQEKFLEVTRTRSIKTTMDRYVHVTEDSLINAVKQFENYFS